MSIVNSFGLPNVQLTSKEHRSNGFYLKTSFGIFAFCLFVFLLNLQKRYLYLGKKGGSRNTFGPLGRYEPSKHHFWCGKPPHSWGGH